MMKITFALDWDDMITISKIHHRRHPAKIKERKTESVIHIILGIIIVVYHFSIVESTIRITILAAGVFLIAFGIFYKRVVQALGFITPWILRFSKYQPETVEYEIREEHLLVTEKNRDIRIAWENIETAEEIEGYYFINMNSPNLHVIPRNKLAMGEYEVFVGEIEKRLVTTDDTDYFRQD